MWFPRSDTRTEKGIGGKPGEIQRKCGVWFIVICQRPYFNFDKCTTVMSKINM